MQAVKLCLLCLPALAQQFGIFHYLGIYRFFVDTVGGAEFLAMTVVALANILYPAVAVPVADHGYEGITAVTAGEQSGISVRCPVAISGSGFLF